MSRDRILAVLLLLIAFATLVASRALPVLDDVPGPAKVAIVVVGVVCGLAGVGLWLRKGSEQP
jgi:hypothetical protein